MAGSDLRVWCGVGRVWSGGDESGFVGGDDGLGAVAEPELVEDVADVGLDGFLGDDEAVGDLGVGQALGDELEDFGFAWGEVFERGLGLGGCGWAPGEIADQSSGDVGCE